MENDDIINLCEFCRSMNFRSGKCKQDPKYIACDGRPAKKGACKGYYPRNKTSPPISWAAARLVITIPKDYTVDIRAPEGVEPLPRYRGRS